MHDHYFFTDAGISVGDNDYVYAWVYIDPDNPPEQVSLQLNGYYNGWAGAYWGVDNQYSDLLLQYGYYQFSIYGGQLSSTGGWQRLAIPMSGLMGGDWIQSIDYMLLGGSVYWGESGSMYGSPNAPENLWVGDQVPGNVSYDSYGGDTWNWKPYFRRSWLQAGGDSTHSGNNDTETKISRAEIARTGLARVSGHTYPATPLGAIVRASASGHDTIYSSTGATLKGTDVYTGTTTSAPSTSGGKEQLANPAIDPSLSFVYHVGTDGCVHKYSADLASEYLGPGAGTPGGSASGCFDGTNGQAGWPQLLTKFTQAFCTARAGLTVATSGTLRRLYAGVSCNDSTFMDGNVTTIDQNGNQTVFNVNCANQTKHYGPGGCNVSHVAGVWSRAGVLFDPITQRLFATTGDGDFTPDDLNTPTWGYSFLALNPNGTGHSSSYYASYPIDSFTPSSWGGDEDLGSTNALIVNVYNPTYPTLAIVSGGDGVARVLNASNLGGAPSGVRGTELTNIIVPSLQGTTCNEGNCKPTSPMATWTNPADSTPWVFIREPNGVNALAVAPNYGGKPFLYEGWPNPIATTNGHGGLFVANNVLYWSDSMGLHAADPTTGVIKWTDSQNVATGFSTPVVVNGVLYFQGVMYTIGGVAPSTSDVPWVNLAEGRPTYQSTIYGSWTSDLAVNGSTDGNFFHNSAFHTYNGGCSIIPGRSGGPCWKVDLGGTHTVKQVVLYNRTDCCQQRLSHFWIGGHNANGYFMASDQSNFVGSSATAVVPIDLNISTDQIVVQLGASGGDNYLHLAEVQVLGN